MLQAKKDTDHDRDTFKNRDVPQTKKDIPMPKTTPPKESSPKK